ncbi:Quinone oxidoreductase [Hypsibius exemplaris]|uniref:Quinone oxidoreductase n=1 Tax=Hypsibius exemplaris TaxID=2072580 RepID=A0A1W0WWN3_HYPEX|nr:Quinone oxidoreductase [Hypsibius exemplaris]
MHHLRSSIMKAVRISKFGGPEVLQLETVKIPVPQGNQVLVQVKAAGVNPVDTYIRNGGHPAKSEKDLPFTPGSDAAGLVAAVGPDVSDVQVGDRVFVCDLNNLSGSYGEYMLVSSSRRVFPLPERLSFSQGAALGVPYFTVLRALKYKAHAKSGETVFIHGASGGVGLAACQLASAWPLDVVGTASTEEGAKLVRSAGARIVVDHKDPHHRENLKKATNGKGFDIILEMLSNVNLPLDLEVAAEYGRIVIVGSRGKVEIDPRAIMNSETVVTAVMLGKTTDGEFAEMGKDLLKAINDQSVNPIIDLEIPLERASEAHQAKSPVCGESRQAVRLDEKFTNLST